MKIRTQLAFTLSAAAAFSFLVAWLIASMFATRLVVTMIEQIHARQSRELTSVVETALRPQAKAADVLSLYLDGIPRVIPSVDYVYVDSPGGRPGASVRRGGGIGAKSDRTREYEGSARSADGTSIKTRLGVAADLAGTVRQDVRRFLLPSLAVFSLTGIVLSVILGSAVSFLLSRPILELASAAEQVAAGDLSVQVPVETSNELGDLTSRFNEMVGRMRKLVEAKDAYVADVSHDLRSPMAAVKTTLDFMLHDDPDRDRLTGEQRALLESLAENAARLEGFVNNVLDAAKMNAGKARYRCVAVALEPIARGLVSLFGIAAKRKGVSLEIALPPGLPHLLADPDSLERALANLMSNALKFTPSGGRIILGAEAAAESARVFVRDTGVGISKQALPRLFERFERGDAAEAVGGEAGTGLGLHLVRASVEAMGGEVRIESEEGKGTCVALTLPFVFEARPRMFA